MNIQSYKKLPPLEFQAVSGRLKYIQCYSQYNVIYPGWKTDEEYREWIDWRDRNDQWNKGVAIGWWDHTIIAISKFLGQNEIN